VADRTGAQKALTALGYDAGAPDGVIGVNTRVAIRAWQKARGIPPDGYLTPALSAQIQADAGLASPPTSQAPIPGQIAPAATAH
jgi:peptidoglycan hydrolase-like protein with peptidoglycan-binding domain